jgi:hypothetical protein
VSDAFGATTEGSQILAEEILRKPFSLCSRVEAQDDMVRFSFLADFAQALRKVTQTFYLHTLR